MQPAYQPPASECERCPRLVAFRQDNQRQYPSFFNGAVPSFGAFSAELLVVGLAPGLKGANQTGRPFTGDYAGLVLYSGLLKTGFAQGIFDEHPDDGLELLNCRVTNAVRCVPPENKPIGEEIATCRSFLTEEISAMPNLKVILSLGGISHKSVLAALRQKQSAFPFVHGAAYDISHPTAGKNLTLANSYHCSRYNINTGRLTQEMFDNVLVQIQNQLS